MDSFYIFIIAEIATPRQKESLAGVGACYAMSVAPAARPQALMQRA